MAYPLLVHQHFVTAVVDWYTAFWDACTQLVNRKWYIEYLYSPNKYGTRVNNTNTIKTTQLQIRQKTLKARFKFRHTRLAHNTLGRAKPKYSWQYFTISIFLVVKSFMKNLLITKSRDWRSDLVKGHASRPYSSAGKHLALINWRVTYSEATRPTLAKAAFAAR